MRAALLAAFPRFADIIYNRRQRAGAEAETFIRGPSRAWVTKFENEYVHGSPFVHQIATGRES